MVDLLKAVDRETHWEKGVPQYEEGASEITEESVLLS